MEHWKAIPGYEGLYEASNLGRIRTAEGKTTSSARFPHRVWKQRIMKLKYQDRKCGKKDARVCLWKDGKEKTYLVSRLVALAWCDGYKDGMTVNHIDGNPQNNCSYNLEWISLADNIKHGFDTGLFSSQKECILVSSTGEKRYFRSKAEAARYLGRAKSYIWLCESHNRPIKSINGEIYGML